MECNIKGKKTKRSLYVIIITVCIGGSFHLISICGYDFKSLLPPGTYSIGTIGIQFPISHNSNWTAGGVIGARGNKSHSGTSVIVKSKTTEVASNGSGPGQKELRDMKVKDFSLCKEARLMPKGSMPVIALASLQGSGNTWLRYLIERVTGIYTGSIYNDPELISRGFKGESTDPYGGETVVVKMHEMHDPSRIDGTIFLVRDLHQAIMADFNRVQGLKDAKSRSHTFVVQQSRFNTSAFRKCASILTNATWRDLIKAIMENFSRTHKLLVIHYDDLKTDLAGQLERIVEFLELPLNKKRLKCTLQQPEGGFHRKRHDLSFDPFDDTANDQIRSAVKFAQDSMKVHGLPPLQINGTG